MFLIIIQKLNFPNLSIIVYINLYLLYKYLIKLRIIKKKYFIINIIVFQ